MERKTHWVKWAQICDRKLLGELGLRKFDLFNQSMLAKQGWNILTNPNSFLARLYKALYLPNTYFLRANSPCRSSLYWRGLLWGRCLLIMGIGWRVGNDNHINIREDNWLQGDTRFKLYHPHIVPPHLVKVVDIITCTPLVGIPLFYIDMFLLSMLIELPNCLRAPILLMINLLGFQPGMANSQLDELTGLDITCNG